MLGAATAQLSVYPVVSFIRQVYPSVLSCAVIDIIFSTSSSDIVYGQLSSVVTTAELFGYLIICAVNILPGDCRAFVQTLFLQSCCIFIRDCRSLMETSGSYLSSSGQFVAGVVADILWTVSGSKTRDLRWMFCTILNF